MSQRRARPSAAARTLALAVGLALWPGAAWACSGPGAAAAIERAQLGGHGLVLVSLLLAVSTTVVARAKGVRSSPLVMAWLLLVAHPGIWVSATSGDCGRERWLLAGLFSVVEAVLLGWAWVRPPALPSGHAR